MHLSITERFNEIATKVSDALLKVSSRLILAKNDAEFDKIRNGAFLSKYANVTFNIEQKAELTFVLEQSDNLESHSYSLCDTAEGFFIRGGTESALLCGVYELLGTMGIFFDTNVEALNGALNFDVLKGMNDTIKPLCRNRGIRQHINFPMDISSYSLKNAQEYIKNLARMQMNKMVNCNVELNT